MFLLHCHLHFSALTQTVVGEDGRDLLYTFCNLDEDCWFQGGEGCSSITTLFATNLGTKKVEPTPPLPRKQLPSYTEKGYAQGLVCCWILAVGCFFHI